MDPTALAVLLASMAILGIIVGGALTEVLARRREEQVERRLELRQKAANLRARRLEAIDETKRDMSSALTRALIVPSGDPSGGGIPTGPHAYPRSDPMLINDAKVADMYFTLAADLASRPARGERATATDMEKASLCQAAISQVLAKQEDRVERGEAPTKLDPGALQANAAEVLARMMAGAAASDALTAVAVRDGP
jgi:hypothetical protein